MPVPDKLQELLRQLTDEICLLSNQNQRLAAEKSSLSSRLNSLTQNKEGQIQVPSPPSIAWSNGDDVESIVSAPDVDKMRTKGAEEEDSSNFIAAVPTAPNLPGWAIRGKRSVRVTPIDADKGSMSQLSETTTSKPALKSTKTTSKAPPSKALSVNKALKLSGFEAQKQNSLVINPETNSFMNFWEVVILTVLSYVALVAPVQVAILPAPQSVDGLLVINCLVDLVFLSDMGLQFFTMYQRKTKVGYRWEHRLKRISCHYLQSWFIIDLVSIIPFDLISFLSESEAIKSAKAVKLVRLLRLLKLVRLCRSTRFFRLIELHISVTYGNLALMKYFCMLLVIAHWLANLWALTLVLVDKGSVDRWIDGFTERELEINVVELTEETPWKLYLTSLYFTIYTITSVGYGDVGPKNYVETCVAIFMVVVSGISWAILLGQVCGVVASLGEEESEFRSTMDGLNAMMSDQLLPSKMRFRLRSFFLSSKLAHRRVQRHQRLITFMSPGLQGEVVMTLNKKWMEKVKMITPIISVAQDVNVENVRRRSDSKAFLVDLSMTLQTHIFSQEEAIGNPHTLYILQRGIIGGRGRVFNSGAVWGEDFLLLDISLAFPYEATTLTYVELSSLTRESFLGVMERYCTKLPELPTLVRYHCRWLAVQRGIRREVWRRMGRNGQSKTRLQ